MRVPSLPGVLTAAEVERTAASLASMQEPDGAVPFTTGQHADAWNHVEAAMALLVGGRVAEAEAAYDWVLRLQRPDGSLPMRVERGEVTDARGEVNISAYLAVGVLHHWQVRGDSSLVERCWPTVARALDWVVAQQADWGGLTWTPTEEGALLAGSSSVYQSLRAGLALLDLVQDSTPGRRERWEAATGRLGHAVRHHRDRFLDKSTYSMDWYYPVLGGAVRGAEAQALLATRWDDFVRPGLGIRCVDTNPWVTGAETAELVMALDAVGAHEDAHRLLADVQHLRAEDGGYWTGWVYGDDVVWPQERTTYTAAAVVLAVDALAARHGTGTGGSGIMRGEGLAPHPPETGLRCGCPDALPISPEA
ncbi:prenyltransferase [Nocardioides bruguierae]|uniref:prenyltransferase n=1 Tax=Nocardioides bruguierae TaxID=2945102 RepID=UPI002020BB59|nr:prenyltransferase [Nocardioides bruguierae]MCL8024400.1 prenyltransferase [Nocardioides bruguierae]